MTESFTITVPGPLGEHLGQNYRGHWRPKYEATAAAREAWFLATGWDEGRWDGTMFERVKLTIAAYLCRRHPKRDSPDYLASKTGARPTDNDNLMAMMKPAIDGLKDAGLYADDTAEHVTYGPPEITWVDTFAEERVEILVEPMDGEVT